MEQFCGLKTNLISDSQLSRSVVQGRSLCTKLSKRSWNRKWERKKCIRQFALNAERTVKFRSSLTQAGRFTAENAGQRKETQEEDSKLDWWILENHPSTSFFSCINVNYILSVSAVGSLLILSVILSCMVEDIHGSRFCFSSMRWSLARYRNL